VQRESCAADATRELAALNAIAAVVSRSLDLQEILNDALDKTLEVTGLDSGGVYLLDEAAGVLHLVAHRGHRPELVAEIDRLRLGEGFSGRVAETGQPLLVHDISADPRLTRLAVREEGYSSLASVPLLAKGRVLGTLYTVTRLVHEFSAQDLQLLTSIGNQIGVAVENARLFEAAQRQAEQFRLISEVGRQIIAIQTVDPLLDEIARQVNEILGYYVVGIGLIDGNEVVVQAGVGPYWKGPDRKLFRLQVGQEGIVGRVAHTGQPLLVPDVSQEPRYYPVPEIPDTRSELAVPMRTQQGVIGVLDVQSRRLAAFDGSDVVVLQALADQAAVAIEKARLLEAERKRADELDALRTTLADITAELELSALLEAIVERAASLLDATGGELGLYDDDSQELRIVVSHELGKDYVGTRHTLGEGAMGRVAETVTPLIIDDYQTWPGRLPHYSRIHATLAAPLTVGGRLVGVFTTVTSDPERRFTPDDLHLLTLFAQQAAIAVENARLYEQAQQLAALEERQRLARDLHDSVTQALWGVMLYGEAAAGQLVSGQLERATEHLRELQAMAQYALAEMRLLIHELRPPILEAEGLVAALQARLQAVEGRAGLKASLQVHTEDETLMPERLPAEIEDGLYRIAQEALNNALKHAQAHTLTVSLSLAREAVSLEITDDGAGFDLQTAREQGGLGLAAMDERAQELGGRLAVTSRPGAGTRVRVDVPSEPSGRRSATPDV
jgi:signal transduction histidine kinase